MKYTTHFCGDRYLSSLFLISGLFIYQAFAYIYWCRLHIPDHMLPQTHHPTAISVLRSDNPTVLNVLIDVVDFLFLWVLYS